jgi:hypothetical protein
MVPGCVKAWASLGGERGFDSLLITRFLTTLQAPGCGETGFSQNPGFTLSPRSAG